jgi:tripartite-type tricarboxylate transporter receptor subunit TctC
MARPTLCVAAAFSALTALLSSALAQPGSYPNHNVEVIVPYGPGGSTDMSLALSRRSSRTGSASPS